MLPLPRNDKNVLTSEQDLLNRRHKQWVEYVVTGGRASEAATSVEAAEVEERVSRVQKAIGGKFGMHLKLWTPQ